jgi:hypothetical protein
MLDTEQEIIVKAMLVTSLIYNRVANSAGDIQGFSIQLVWKCYAILTM